MTWLVDIILWNMSMQKWSKNSSIAAMPNNSAHVELSVSGMPSTGPAPLTRTLPLPIKCKPNNANSLSGSRDPSLAAQIFLCSCKHSTRACSPPWMNRTWHSRHWDTSGRVSTYLRKVGGANWLSSIEYASSWNTIETPLPCWEIIVARTREHQSNCIRLR